MTSRILTAVLALFLCAGPLMRAQEREYPTKDTTRVSPTPEGTVHPLLTLTSEPESLRVYLDSELLGITPLVRVPVAPGAVRLKIFSSDSTEWFSACVVDTFTATESGTIERHVDFPVWIRVVSEPPGADVLLGDSGIGVTPLLAYIPRGTAYLTLRSDGYDPYLLFLSPALRLNLRAVMTPSDPGSVSQGVYLTRNAVGSYTTVYIATASAVVTGAAAAVLKSRADSFYDEYRETGSGQTLDRVKRYDLLSGIALVATEISLGYLIYELLSR